MNADDSFGDDCVGNDMVYYDDSDDDFDDCYGYCDSSGLVIIVIRQSP